MVCHIRGTAFLTEGQAITRDTRGRSILIIKPGLAVYINRSSSWKQAPDGFEPALLS
ncbi:hypothetical protein SC499_22775 [Peribacillus simplex]|uniref:hypothetical protein n=1 Tax=Peribacillus simplex TaxID=1478 RepID=UPI00298DF8C0|nr:hypothetical protein [Peribacillus simplex]MDW7617427.1 hypothetical protein [Peribacillus simplex]